MASAERKRARDRRPLSARQNKQAARRRARAGLISENEVNSLSRVEAEVELLDEPAVELLLAESVLHPVAGVSAELPRGHYLRGESLL